MPVFVDTNVFIYAVDTADPVKQRAAQAWKAALWESRSGRTSFQVLQEFYVNVAAKVPGGREKARAEIRDLLAWSPISIDGSLLDRGWQVQDRYRLSFWDSLIVAAAQAASCRHLLTEDLQDGQEIGGVEVVSPFRRSYESLA